MRELSFADVSRHFDLPLTQAADRMNVCVTLVKRVCRENGVSRWPYRKLQSRRRREMLIRQPSLDYARHAHEKHTAHARLAFGAPQVGDSDDKSTLKGLVDFVESHEPEDVTQSSMHREEPRAHVSRAPPVCAPPVGTATATTPMLPSGAMLLRAACKRLGFVYAEMWTPASNAMLTMHSCSANEDDATDPMRAFAEASSRISLPSGSGLPGRVWATMQPEWSTDCSAQTLGLATAAGIPLLSPSSRSHFLGVAVFFATQRAASTLEIMQALGNIGAILAYHLTGVQPAKAPAQQLKCVLAPSRVEQAHAAGSIADGGPPVRGAAEPTPQPPPRTWPPPAARATSQPVQVGPGRTAAMGMPPQLAAVGAPRHAPGSSGVSPPAACATGAAGAPRPPMGPPSHLPAGHKQLAQYTLSALPQLGMQAPHAPPTALHPSAAARAAASTAAGAPSSGPANDGADAEMDTDMRALADFAQTATRLVQESLLQVASRGPTAALEAVTRGFSVELARLAARRAAPPPSEGGVRHGPGPQQLVPAASVGEARDASAPHASAWCAGACSEAPPAAAPPPPARFTAAARGPARNALHGARAPGAPLHGIGIVHSGPSSDTDATPDSDTNLELYRARSGLARPVQG